MEQTIREHLNNLYNPYPIQRQASLEHLLALTEQPVDWASETWDELMAMLASYDNDERIVAIQVMANLAKNDPDRMLNDLDTFMVITLDAKPAIARLAIQCLWKIAVLNSDLQKKVTESLSKRFKECEYDKESSPKRHDIITCFRNIYNVIKDDKLRQHALTLVATDPDKKNRQQLGGIWFDLRKPQKKQV